MQSRVYSDTAIVLGALLLAACGSTDTNGSAPGNTGGSSGNGTGGAGGGQASTGGSTAASADAGYDPNATAGCAAWPASKYVPYLGVRFYGPDPGPCSITQRDGTTLAFTYDSSNLPTGATSSDGTLTWTYTYSNGLVTSESDVDTTTGTTLTYTYVYGANTVTYAVTNSTSASNNYTATYQLDDRGYPQITTIQGISSSTYPHRYTYTYENCRITTRTAYLDDGTVSQSYSWAYAYDTEGHLISMSALDASWRIAFDYSCW